MTERKRIGITIPVGLYKELKEEAEIAGYTLNSLILQIITNWIKQNSANN